MNDNVIRIAPRPERFEMRCGNCDGGLWAWHYQKGSNLICCLMCTAEYELPGLEEQAEAE